MSGEKMREEFESFVGGNGFFNDFSRSTIHQDVYRRPSVELMWLSWKASRASIEIEISGYDSLLRALYDGVDINDVVESIQSQGIRVKVTP